MNPAPENQRSLLAFMAHPSDEAFSIGGTLALYAHRGVKVYVVAATRGEVGDMDSKLLQGYGSIAARREAELQDAARVLGLSGVYFLNYRDSGMPGSPEYDHPNALAAQHTDEVAARVVHFLRRLQPQVVITHDPIGGYKHPDHIALQRAVKRAFEVSADPRVTDYLLPFKPQKLYYQTISKRLLRWAVKLAPLFGLDPQHFGRNRDIDLASLVEEGDFPIHARIDCRSVADIRAKASACHVSQGGDTMSRRGPLGFLYHYFGSMETFMRALPPPEKGLHERDLFKGVI
ncbi:MAG TPA: PIG-L family deacetylase [Anaerolineales bacterium]|nr:PIG-L family deacetylase [Anaerolineales bacterium]